MEDNQCRIETDATDTRPFGSSCGWDSICQLKPDSPFDSPLIDTIVALLDDSAASEPRPVYLGTDVYTEMNKEGFGNSKSLVNHIPRDRQWLFGICEGNHWCAMDINWPEAKISVYDPQGFRARARRDKITDVCTHSSDFSLPEAHIVL